MVRRRDNKSPINRNPINKRLKEMNDLQQEITNQISGSGLRAKEQEELQSSILKSVDYHVQGINRGRSDDETDFMFRNARRRDDRRDEQASSRSQEVSRLFEEQAESFYSLFQDDFRTSFDQMNDILMISKRMTDLQNGLEATRDSILTSDNLTATISRTLSFGADLNDDSNEEKSRISLVETMEKEEKIFAKIRDHITPKTLLYGNMYVYTVPYSVLFERHQYLQEGKITKLGESCGVSGDEPVGIPEGILIDVFGEEYSVEDVNTLENLTKNIMSNIHISEMDDGCIEESGVVEAVVTAQEYILESAGSGKNKGNKIEDFSDIKDCHIKILDPRKVIPVKILDKVIGYYYMHSKPNDPNKTITTSMNLDVLRTAGQRTTNARANANEVPFIRNIVNNIIEKFNKPFLKENEEFRDIIVDALLYDENYSKNIQFQFIPKEYITEFKVNEDEEGNGHSMLEPAMFYGKLYVGILSFNSLMIVSKSYDQQVIYVRSSLDDKDVANQIQKTSRAINQNMVNFNDLMSYPTMLTKVGKGKTMFIPVGPTGERGIEFDTIAGQNVSLYTDLTEDLKKSAVDSIGVPSVLSNFINEADFAKTLVMANSKYLARCVIYQQSFNEGITEMYKKILKYKGIFTDEELDSFEFKLVLPETLNSLNFTDLTNNIDQLASFIVKTITGEQASQEEEDNVIKDKLYTQVVRNYMKMIDWDLIDGLYESAILEAKSDIEKSKDAKNSGEDSY